MPSPLEPLELARDRTTVRRGWETEMDALIAREYRRERSDGTLMPASVCHLIARERVRGWRSADVVEVGDGWGPWEPVEGHPGALRRVRVEWDEDYEHDVEPIDVAQEYAELRRRGLARHVAQRVAEARADRWNRAPDYVVGVIVEVNEAGRTGTDSLWGIGVEYLSDPYLLDVVADCTAEALRTATSAA